MEQGNRPKSQSWWGSATGWKADRLALKAR
jgi:hypothetical protein